MPPPASSEERDIALGEFQAFMKSGDPDGEPPGYWVEEDSNFLGGLLGTLFHFFLAVIRYFVFKLRFWSGVQWIAKLRIKTDQFSIEPGQCGLNVAYTYLGLSRLKKQDILGAVEALRLSGLVWPCPHNTTFGLKRGLANALKPYPEAQRVIDEYFQIVAAFKA